MAGALDNTKNDGLYRVDNTQGALPGVDMSEVIPVPGDDLLAQLDAQITDAEAALVVLRTLRKSLADIKASGATHFTPADLNLPI